MRALRAPSFPGMRPQEGRGRLQMPSEEFFLLTVAHEANEHGRQEGPAGVSRFGLLVADVDAAHRRALDAGAAEVSPPVDTPWKPRWSCVADPSANRIDLYQA